MKSYPSAHHGVKWGVDVYLHSFLISTLDGDEWSASIHGCFTSRKRVPDRPYILIFWRELTLLPPSAIGL